MWFFILGNHPYLSVAEILAVLGQPEHQLVAERVLLVETAQVIDPARLIRRLDGTIKLGKICQTPGDWQPETIAAKAVNLLATYAGKLKFGFSVYGHSQLAVKSLALELKTVLKQRGQSSRWVTSQDAALSSVVVEQNNLLTQGAELVIIQDRQQRWLGQTLAVQAFKELSWRDYGRPSRDDYSGMLPPKLAQIMLNLSQTSFDQVLLDPFCGSGTVLAEALLMGFQQVQGSDLSAKAISDSQNNLLWLQKQGNFFGHYNLQVADVTQLNKILPANSVGAVVTEPYLGPQRGRLQIKQVQTALQTLYQQALRQLYPILQPQGRVVMVWPIFNQQLLQVELGKFSRLQTDNVAGQGPLIYSRAGQRLQREIVLLQKS